MELVLESVAFVVIFVVQPICVVVVPLVPWHVAILKQPIDFDRVHVLS